MALPDAVEYGSVSWRAVSAAADGIDVDGLPDAVPVTGTVTFTPSARVMLALNEAPPVTVFATPVAYELDAFGVLRDQEGRDEITLVATDSAGLTPTGWTWTCSYRLNGGLVRGSFSFALPADEHVDLTTVAPVASAGGVSIIQGPRGLTGPQGPPFADSLEDFDTLTAGLVEDDTAETAVALRAAFGRAAPVLSDFVYESGTGNLLSYKEDGITITLTYNADGTVHTSKRGTEPTQTYSYSAGNLVGVA